MFNYIYAFVLKKEKINNDYKESKRYLKIELTVINLFLNYSKEHNILLICLTVE